MSQTPARRFGIGMWALVVALVGLVVLTFLPSPYVIQRPGPVYDTLGTASSTDGAQVPLIEIEGAPTYETAGALRLTTIEVVGNRQNAPSWLELALAWLDRSRAVVPIESIFPAGLTSEQRNERNAALMDESQNEARAAALRELGHEVPAEVEVTGVSEGSPADGLLEEGDMLLALDGVPLTSSSHLRGAIQDAQGAVLSFDVRRGDERMTVGVTPADAGGTWLVGVYPLTHYDFPIDVTIQLDNVGGPSAGLMFALGIIDRLTPGDIAGGADVAGTGTIDSDGTVGPIGGIRQKLYGARDAGSTFFFAPEANCGEVVGNVPDGLQVIRTATLDDALSALDVISDGGDTAALPSCATSVADPGE